MRRNLRRWIKCQNKNLEDFAPYEESIDIFHSIFYVAIIENPSLHIDNVRILGTHEFSKISKK